MVTIKVICICGHVHDINPASLMGTASAKKRKLTSKDMKAIRAKREEKKIKNKII